MEKTICRPEYKILLDLLKEIRKESGLNQEAVARGTGFSQSMVSKVERGERRLDIAELREWCAVMGVTLPSVVARFEADLLKGTARRQGQ